VRSALVTVLVAGSMAGGVFAGGWALQAAALPAPQRGNTAGAGAVTWLLRYRLVESAFRINHGPVVHGRCLVDWFPQGNGLSSRGTLLRLDDGVSLLSVPPHGLDVDDPYGAEPKGLPLVQLELAGCPRVLAPAVAQLVQSRRNVHVERAFAAGRPALSLRVTTSRTHITLYLAPKTARPIAIAVTSPRFSGRGRLSLTRLTPAMLNLLRGRP
jgi:hypothetical protein